MSSGRQFHRQCRHRHLRRAGLPAVGARHRRAFDGDHQRHLVVPLQHSPRVDGSWARQWWTGRAVPNASASRTAGITASSPAMTAMLPASALSTNASSCSPATAAGLTASTASSRPAASRRRIRTRDFVALRFHLHPETRLSRRRGPAGPHRIGARRRMDLLLQRRRAGGRGFDLLRRPAGPQRSRQIVLAFKRIGNPGSAWR